MRVVIAPDSFKGSTSSLQVARAIERGLRQADDTATTTLVALADGGEGTVEALTDLLGGERVTVTVRDPLDRPVEAAYGWVAGRRLAIIEMAAASGLPLLAGGLDPHRASSAGTGDLIRDALDRGAERLILGLGGSATIDAGTGLLSALGARFLDAQGQPVRGAGGALGQIDEIDLSGLDARLHALDITIASDVTSPLLGPEGAVAVFGPQKGVTRDSHDLFEGGMASFADRVVAATGVDRRHVPGAGAAGGIGYLLHSVLDGVEVRDGFSLIAEIADLKAHMAAADLVITGEGRLDAQSLVGKVPLNVARLGRAVGVPTVALAGSVAGDPEAFRRAGLAVVVPIVDGPMSLDEAMAEAPALIERAAARLMAAVRLGTGLHGRGT